MTQAAAARPLKRTLLDMMPLARDFGRFLRWTGRTFFSGRRAAVSVLAIALFLGAVAAGWKFLPANRTEVLIAAGVVGALAFLLVAMMFVRSRFRFIEEQRIKALQGFGQTLAKSNAEAQKLTYTITGEISEKLNVVNRRLEQLGIGFADLKQSAGQDTARRLDRLEGDVWLAIERVEDESKGQIKDAATRAQSGLDAVLARLQRSEAEVEGRQGTAIQDLFKRLETIEGGAETLRADMASAARANDKGLAAATSRGDEILGSLTLTEQALRHEIATLRSEHAASLRDHSAANEAAKAAVTPVLDRLGKLEPRMGAHEQKMADAASAQQALRADIAKAKEQASAALAEAKTLGDQVSTRVERAERQVTLQAESRIATASELAALRGRVEQITAQGTQAQDMIDGLSGSIWQRFGELQARLSTMLETATNDAAEKATRLAADVEALKSGVGRSGEPSADDAQRMRASLQSDFDATVHRIDAIAAQGSAMRSEMDTAARRLATIDSDVQRRTDETARALQSLTATVEQSARVLQRFGGANAGIAQPYARYLTEDKLQRLEKHWTRLFGVTLSRPALAQLAHQVCQAEERCTGGFAGPIETLMMRLLALRALPKGDLDILEIGSQYGVGAGLMHAFPGGGHDKVRLTLIDPLDKSYGDTSEVAGVPVGRGTLERNLATLGVPAGEWRLIQRRSTEHEALIEARDRRYDVIIIDGDHSVPGVAFDFEAYGPMLKPGGILIFDDYGNEQWPGVQPFVDDYVRPRPDWVWVGGEYRLGIMRRRLPGEEALADIATTNVSPLFAERR